MAFSHGKDAAIYVGGYKFTCYARSVTRSGRKQLADVTTLCDDAEKFLPGQQGGTLSIEGLFDPAFAAVLDSEFGNGSALPVTYVTSTETTGGDAYILSAREMSFDIQSQVGDAVAAVVQFQADDRVSLGQHFGEVGVTGTGAVQGFGTISQFGAITNLGLGNYHILAISGGTASAMELKSDDNGSLTTPVTRLTFGSTRTAIGGHFASTTTATTDDYWRPVITLTTSETATVLAAIATD